MPLRDLTAVEAAAMYHFYDRYGAQRGGAIEFYAALTQRERTFLADMVAAIVVARERELKAMAKDGAAWRDGRGRTVRARKSKKAAK